MSTQSPISIPIIFDNQTSIPAGNVWVQFLNGTFGPGQTGAGGTLPLEGNVAYSLADLNSRLPELPDIGEAPNACLNDFTNGRIYINFGEAGLALTGAGYQPDSANPNDPNYLTTYVYVELNVFGNPANNMDISNIDFFSIPIEASTWKGGKAVHALTYAQSSPGALGAAAQALARLSSNQAVVLRNGALVRIGGPGLVKGYHDWASYFAFLESQPQPAATIAGTYGGQGPGSSGKIAHQDYTLTATFAKTAACPNGAVTLVGKADVVGNTTIVIDYADLNAPTGVYGANPPYTINGTMTAGITNDVYGWVVADLLTCLNCGFLGSTTNVSGQPLGQYTSSQMIKLASDSLKPPATPLIFGGVQPSPDYYNSYAAEILKMSTDVYGFPFSDRIQQPLLYFPPQGPHAVDYLKISILPLDFSG